MSDWAAKLSQKPAFGQSGSSSATSATSGASSNTQTSGQQVSTAWGQQNVQSQSQKISQNSQNKQKPQNKQNQSASQGTPDSATSNQGQNIAKHPRQASPQARKSASPEPFNGTEILAFLESRYLADLKEAQEDKSGDHVMVYRSLESSSSWKTKVSGSGRKHAREDGSFDLLSELNRSFPAKNKRY